MFDEQFFTQIGLADLEADQKSQLTKQLTELVQNEMSLRIAKTLSEEQLGHFDTLLESGKDEEAQEYLLKVYPAYNDDLKEAALKVKQSFLEDMQQLVKTLEEDTENSR